MYLFMLKIIVEIAYKSLRENEGDDESVQAECFSENEDQDHTHEYAVLLRIGSHTRVSDNTDCETCG